VNSSESGVAGEGVGGGLTHVVRVGETIRRAAGYWTPTVQALLGHLQQVGFAGAPRPFGTDPQGREVLEFVVGSEATHADDELARVARMIAALHRATASFKAPLNARWQFMVGAPGTGEVICHNDLSPDNTIYLPAGNPRAFIDWDLAAPGSPLWDLAWAAYRFVPLYDDATCERLGYPILSRPARLRILCDAYGLDDRQLLLPTVCERIRVLYETARAWGEEGRPGWREVWADTRGEQWLRGLRYVETERHHWEQQLA
jgi:aminoglycoside phosphotransferase (APT) family kinase protein